MKLGVLVCFLCVYCDFTDFEKPQNDNKNYLSFTLENQIKCLVISDPDTDIAGASVSVEVGSLDDYPELMGIAHFLEHMLFQGTKSYPGTNEYFNFISQYDGVANAYTAEDHTNYHFVIKPDGFEGALERLGKFFKEPLITESAMMKELNNVESEHQKNIPSDIWRNHQLQKNFRKAPFNKFSTGNFQTLYEIPKQQNLNLYQKLLEFYEEKYSANLMTVVILGNQSVDILKKLVVENFAAVENKDLVRKTFENPSTEYNRIIYMIPISQAREVKIKFDLEPLAVTKKDQNMMRLVSHVVGYEGKGSLLSVLKELNYATSLLAGERYIARGVGEFVVTVGLTETGLQEIDTVLRYVFSYIELLRNDVIAAEKQWEEMRKVTDINFRFQSNRKASLDYIAGLATRLGKDYFRMKTGYILKGHEFGEFDEKEFKNQMASLVPEKANFVITANEYQNGFPDGLIEQKEKYYGTSFVTKIIGASDLNSVKSIINVRESLAENLYDAALAKYEVNIEIYQGIEIKFSGFTEKIEQVLLMVLDKMSELQISEDRFNEIYKNYLRNIENDLDREPYKSCFYKLIKLLRYGYVDGEEKLKVADDPLNREFLQLSEIQKYWTNIFLPRLSIDVLLTGNTNFQKENQVLTKFAVQILANSAFHHLRTVENLGYVVFLKYGHNRNQVGVEIIVQSNYKPSYIHAKVEEYVKNKVFKEFEKLNSIEFENFKKILKKITKPTNVADFTDILWRPILSNTYDFDLDYTDFINVVDDLKLADVKSTILADMVNTKNALAVYYHGLNAKNQSAIKNDMIEEFDTIKDIQDFHAKSKLFPIETPSEETRLLYNL